MSRLYVNRKGSVEWISQLYINGKGSVERMFQLYKTDIEIILHKARLLEPSMEKKEKRNHVERLD